MMERPNILFIVMDTARARDALPSRNPEKLPNLVKIANEGVEFSTTIANAPWTLPSHASMFTGQYTSDHGTHAGAKQFRPDHDSLVTSLQNAGYTTVAFSNNSWVSPEFGFDRGFDYFYKGWELLRGDGTLARAMRDYDELGMQLGSLIDSSTIRTFPTTLLNSIYAKFLRKRYDYGAKVTNWKIKRWFESEYDGENPFFMFINYLEPHLEYDPPRRYCSFLPDGVSVREAKAIEQDAWEYLAGDIAMSDEDFQILKGLYDSELHYLDYRIGKLREYLSSCGLLEQTFVVIVGDHGENIGDHGLMDHQYALYNTLTHVPLIIRGRGVFTGGHTVSDIIEVRDLFPTILEAADVVTPSGTGISEDSLFDILVNRSDHGKHFAISEYKVPQPDMNTLHKKAPQSERADLSRYDRALHAIHTEEWKYICASDGSEELYQIQDDPREQTDLIGSHEDVRNQLRNQLVDTVGQPERGEKRSESMDSKAQQRLEDLGYI